MPHVHLTTKGKTLADLSSLLTKACTLPVLMVSVADCLEHLEVTVSRIQEVFPEGTLAVRSSAKGEDSFQSSNAGHFRTVLDIPCADGKRISEAVRTVISSYGDCNKDEQVLIQPMLHNITISGVVFTSDLDTLAPYYIVNYDESGRGNAITSGNTSQAKTYIYFKQAPVKPPESFLVRLFEVCQEIETLCDNTSLDIEFACCGDELYILQVRPITRVGKEDLSYLNLRDALAKIHGKIEKLSAPHPNLLGDKVILGVMPDWNPAEIIGLKPKQLALSLYKELVTDNVWAYQRDNYGYRNLRSHPLMTSFLGVPYIDVRVDFNSFIPKSLDESIAEKLADYYLTKLDKSPYLHDKVEFEIVFSCYYLNLPEQLGGLIDHGFNHNEIKRIEFALLDLTNAVIDVDKGLYKQDMSKIEMLRNKHTTVISSNLSRIDKIYWLIEYCKRYGTLPFAGIARAAFIAVQFLKSFVTTGVISHEEYDKFMNSLNTIAKKLTLSLSGLASGNISRSDFLKEYGHLRPGTYDIQSPRYDEKFECYFSTIQPGDNNIQPFQFSAAQLNQIDILLRENGIRCNAIDLLAFITTAIEGREYSKFVFTRTLSEILKLVEESGAPYGFSRDELAFVDIRAILGLYSSVDHRDFREIMQENIETNKTLYAHTKAVRLPHLIRRPADIYGFHLEAETPNFITQKRVSAEIVIEENLSDREVTGKIVFIKSADPGYDFLFAKNIGGLVTQFGGANSHMAIRCAELGIPAVIGAGEKSFIDWAKARVLDIDCANQQVRVVQ